jgi:hypothetical protein
VARLSFKPDASFFRKITIGAVGTRAVRADLAQHGHDVVELERGSTDTKLWKDVKRKRVRIPDLVCLRCGLRVESRAKVKAELSMSHSPTEEERAWDFGMVDTDYVAFPVCVPADERYWSTGRLRDQASYWHERNWVLWRTEGAINYFTARAFRGVPYAKKAMKGVTEGSETSIVWVATFASAAGTVDAVSAQAVTIRITPTGRRQTRRIRPGQTVFLAAGDPVAPNQVIASAVKPQRDAELACPGKLPRDHLRHLLASRERTQRFTGVKLARLLNDRTQRDPVADLTRDAEEDVYIRLEGVAYLAAVGGESVRPLVAPYLTGPDPQTQLEAVIALGETSTPEAVALLSELLDDRQQPYFLRSAAAWCLSRTGRPEATTRLVRAFADIDRSIREEALDGIVTIGAPALPQLLDGIRQSDRDVAAGCAEALRQQHPLPGDAVAKLLDQLRKKNPSLWTVWLLGHLPRDPVAGAIAQLQDSAPQLHYAITLLWSFVDSWIARRWELQPGATFPASEHPHED